MVLKFKPAYYLLLFLCLITVFSCGKKTMEIFVGADGADNNSGTKESPLQNIQAAIKLAEEIKSDNKRTHISIYLLAGDYYLSSPISISSILSDLTISCSGESEVTIKGSIPLNPDWEEYDNNIYIATIEDDLTFDQLFANGKPQILARYPDYNEEGGHWQGHAADAISIERIKSWDKPVGAIFHAMHAYEWGGFHYLISGINEDGSAVLEGGFQNNRPAPPHSEYRMLENVFEELNSPGEWYFDQKQHKLYYWPALDIDIKTADFEAVILRNLVEIKGKINSPVRNVTIKGIKFEQSQRTFMQLYEPLLRSDWTIYRGGALYIENAEKCGIVDCEFGNLGGNAIFVSAYNREIEISGNHIHDCGASGICFVGNPTAVRSPSFQYSEFVPTNELDTVSGPQKNLYPKECIAHNNLIYRTGRIEK